MTKFQLRVNNKTLEVGWSIRLVADFEPVAGCGAEKCWVRVHSVNSEGGTTRYLGVVEDYLTYTKAHGMTQGFMIEFGQENVSEIWDRGTPRPSA